MGNVFQNARKTLQAQNRAARKGLQGKRKDALKVLRNS